MRLIAVIPVSGREDILKITIPRLIKQVYRVILVGHNKNEYIPDTDFYTCPKTTKRGAKWQYAIDKAREYNPDAILISSSGGIFRDDYFDIRSDITGSAGLNYLDFQPGKIRAVYWPGYIGSRESEPIGLGRIITAEFLNKCNWNIYPADVQTGLDYRSMSIFYRYDAKITIRRDNLPMRISSYKYVQTNSFDHMARTNNSKEITDINTLLKYYNLEL